MNGSVFLVENQQRQLGRLTIDRATGDLLAGSFAPEPAYAKVAPLFRAFEEAVDLQALSVVDDLDHAIAALGLHLRRPHQSETMPIHDVQIWSDGGMTCRLSSPSSAGANGIPANQQAATLPK